MIAYEAARLLMARSRWAEALPHLRGVPQRLRGIGARDEADRIESMLAEALLHSGSADEAVGMLRALLDRLPGDAVLREPVTALLAAADKARTDPPPS
jgi:cytochrome c-type biogenesis protein CcmH/NrfG